MHSTCANERPMRCLGDLVTRISADKRRNSYSHARSRTSKRSLPDPIESRKHLRTEGIKIITGLHARRRNKIRRLVSFRKQNLSRSFCNKKKVLRYTGEEHDCNYSFCVILSCNPFVLTLVLRSRRRKNKRNTNF